MAKRITALLYILLCVAGVYGGTRVYHALQNTPERTTQRFMQQLAAGETDKAYAQLAPELTQGRETYWRDFLKQFKDDSTEPRLVAHEQLKDTFNTNAEHAAPERFTYIVKRSGQDQRLTVVTIKVDKSWVIAELTL